MTKKPKNNNTLYYNYRDCKQSYTVYIFADLDEESVTCGNIMIHYTCEAVLYVVRTAKYFLNLSIH